MTAPSLANVPAAAEERPRAPPRHRHLPQRQQPPRPQQSLQLPPSPRPAASADSAPAVSSDAAAPSGRGDGDDDDRGDGGGGGGGGWARRRDPPLLCGARARAADAEGGAPPLSPIERAPAWARRPLSSPGAVRWLPPCEQPLALALLARASSAPSSAAPTSPLKSSTRGAKTASFGGAPAASRTLPVPAPSSSSCLRSLGQGHPRRIDAASSPPRTTITAAAEGVLR